MEETRYTWGVKVEYILHERRMCQMEGKLASAVLLQYMRFAAPFCYGRK